MPPLNTEDRLRLAAVAKNIKSMQFVQKEDGMLSSDETVGIYNVGYWQRRFPGYEAFNEIRLVRKGELVGEGKNWYKQELIGTILDGLRGIEHRLLLRKAGSSPALIALKDADIVVAPYIIP